MDDHINNSIIAAIVIVGGSRIICENGINRGGIVAHIKTDHIGGTAAQQHALVSICIIQGELCTETVVCGQIACEAASGIDVSGARVGIETKGLIRAGIDVASARGGIPNKSARKNGAAIVVAITQIPGTETATKVAAVAPTGTVGGGIVRGR